MGEPQRCLSCVFLVPHSKRRLIGFGTCHRHAPIAVPASPDTGATWPIVWTNIDWCGDYSRASDERITAECFDDERDAVMAVIGDA